jgi:cell division protein FtsL
MRYKQTGVTFTIFVAFLIASIMYIKVDNQSTKQIKQLQMDITQLEYQLSRYEAAINDMQENDATLYNNFQTYLNNCE